MCDYILLHFLVNSPWTVLSDLPQNTHVIVSALFEITEFHAFADNNHAMEAGTDLGLLIENI